MEVRGVVGEHGHDEESAFDEVDTTPSSWERGRGIVVAEDRRSCVTGGVVIWESDGRMREIGCTCQGKVHDKTCEAPNFSVVVLFVDGGCGVGI